jgi:probable HAF family extracellular repeat protein
MFVATSVHGTMGKGAARRWRALWLVWVVVAWAAQPSLAQRLIWLGTLGGDWSEAYGVSADGSVVVGWARNAAGQRRAFRWTAAGGMQDLGTLGGGESWAWGVSADGSVVVGWARNAAGQNRAFRWTAAGGMQDLGTLGRRWERGLWRFRRWLRGGRLGSQRRRAAACLSLDGGGWDAGPRHAAGGDGSGAYGVSADGSVVVGWAHNAAGQWRAFRWTAAGGMQDLGTLGGDWSEASGVSADGSVVVGWAQNAAGLSRAFRWTAAGGMQDLGTLGGDWSEALGVSADGSVVVGWAQTPQGSACLSLDGGGWHGGPEHHLRPPADRRLGALRANAISPDGRYIVGRGYNAATGREEAFLLDTQGTGVEERSGAARVRLRLLPQPARERVVLELEAAEAAGRVTIVVSDVLGRVVAEPLRGAVLPPGVQQRIELDVRAWAAGQYTVVLRTEAGSTAVPLVVVR